MIKSSFSTFFNKGIKLHYVEKGDPTKPLLLFVHGFPEFWYSWRYQLKEFSKDYFCIAIDQRGYSESDRPSKVSDYHIDKMVGDIRQFVKQIGEFAIIEELNCLSQVLISE